jgi:hypothetical protein
MYTMATSTSLSSKEADLCRGTLKDTTCITLQLMNLLSTSSIRLIVCAQGRKLTQSGR